MLAKKAYCVVGLGFGDEGKGLVTDYLCRKSDNPIVIRFNGGHQAGHTVVTQEGSSHVFSNFGSGTLRGVPTYWSKYCTYSPEDFLNEYHSLNACPVIFIDEECAITTHYDVLYNRLIENARGKDRYGSCGVGFGATIDRHFRDSISFHLRDLFEPALVKHKLYLIRQYYKSKLEKNLDFDYESFDHDCEDKRFCAHISEVSSLIVKQVVCVTTEQAIFNKNTKWNTYIFEGAQGILLDKKFGNWPYITKSNTTSTNAIEIIRRCNEIPIDLEIFYVTRAYSTRHGGGPFNECISTVFLKDNENETNHYNDYQGWFRIGYLDIDLLNYALNCDDIFSNCYNKNLIITCLDQLKTEYLPITKGGVIEDVFYKDLPNLLKFEFKNCYFSFSACSDSLFENKLA